VPRLLRTQASARPVSASPWEHRFLIWNFARRDLRSRFKGTLVGWTWSLILPLATVAIYSVVFSVFIRIEPPPFGSGREGSYAVWLLVGMIPWTFMLNGITMSMPTVLGNGPLLQKVYFPSYVPSAGALIAIGIQGLIELGIVLAILAAFGNVGWTWLALPLWALAVVAFVGCLGYVLAIFNVYYRDVAQLVTVAMQMIFFLSPIIYPLTMVPEQWHGIPVRMLLEANPIGQLIIMAKELLYDLTLPSATQVGYMALWVAGLAGLAVWVFRRWGQDVAEAI